MLSMFFQTLKEFISSQGCDTFYSLWHNLFSILTIYWSCRWVKVTCQQIDENMTVHLREQVNRFPESVINTPINYTQLFAQHVTSDQLPINKT